MIDSTSLLSMPFGKAVVTPLPHERAIEAAKALLKEEGFGVLCEIDVAATMREKLDIDFRPYRILGACNPTLARQAISAEPQIGLLLPCNVVVQTVDGQTIVSAIDAQAMLSVAEADLQTVASDVNARLGRVLEQIEKAS